MWAQFHSTETIVGIDCAGGAVDLLCNLVFWFPWLGRTFEKVSRNVNDLSLHISTCSFELDGWGRGQDELLGC